MATERGERMLNYYPEVIKKIQEFKAITHTEGYEFDELKLHSDEALNNAYLLTMDENRIAEWEKILGIRPIENSTAEDRRETIIARIRGQGKLNTELINSIVKTFTGGVAESWIKDSILYVAILPPRDNKEFQFPNVEQELRHKIPAHLGLNVARSYYSWNQVRNTNPTWQDLLDNFSNWEEVYIFNPFE